MAVLSTLEHVRSYVTTSSTLSIARACPIHTVHLCVTAPIHEREDTQCERSSCIYNGMISSMNSFVVLIIIGGGTLDNSLEILLL